VRIGKALGWTSVAPEADGRCLPGLTGRHRPAWSRRAWLAKLRARSTHRASAARHTGDWREANLVFLTALLTIRHSGWWDDFWTWQDEPRWPDASACINVTATLPGNRKRESFAALAARAIPLNFD